MKFLVLAFLLSIQSAYSFEKSKVTFFGEFDLGVGTQSTDSSNEKNKNDLSYGLKLYPSYDTEKIKFELGLGWLSYSVKTDLATGKYSNVRLKTKAPYVYVSPKFKLNESFLLGLEGNYILDNGIMLSSSESTKVMAGVNATYVVSNSGKYEVRTGASLTRSVDSSDRNLTQLLVNIAIGYNPSKNLLVKESLKPNQKEMINGVVYTKNDVTKVILDETLIHFETNSYDLTLKSKALLSELAAFLASHTSIWEGLEITGHTDLRGGDEYNTILSVKRANSVYEVLSNVKLPSDRIIFKGKGKNEPVELGLSDENLAKNRRVELKFYNVSDKDILLNYIHTLKEKYQK